MPRSLTNSALLAILLAAAPAGSVTASETAECFTDWSDAAPIVARERLLVARDVQLFSRRTLDGDVVRLTLCRDGTSYVYRVVLRDARGRITNRTIDARSP